MTHPILHLLIPVITLRFLRFDKKLVYLLSPLALLPDLDILTSMHRVLFHNIFFVMFMAVTVTLFLKQSFPNSWKKIFVIALLMTSFHLLLDTDTYGMAYFYPLSNHIISISGTSVPVVADTTHIDLVGYQISYIFWQIMGIGVIYLILFFETFYTNSIPKMIKEKFAKPAYFLIMNKKGKKN